MGTMAQEPVATLEPTAGRPPPPSHLAALLSAWERHADRIAFVRGDQQLTYGEARAEVFRLARALAAYGVGRGTGVALLASNTPSVLLVPLAVQLLGGYYSAIAPAGTMAERRRVLADTGASVLVVDPSTSQRQAAELLGQLPARALRTVLSLGPSPAGAAPLGADLAALAAAQPAEPISPCGAPDDPAELVYTSGSTGAPKAAAFSFERVGALARFWADEAARGTAETAVFAAPDCRMLYAGPFLRMSAPSVLPMLLAGGTCVLTGPLAPGELLRTIEQESVTATMMTPTQLYRLLDHPGLATADLSGLRLLILHSAPAAPARVAEAVRRLGPVLLQSYGQTEAKMISALLPADHAAAVAGRPQLLRSAGRARAGVQIEIRDTAGRALPPGEVGELCISSPLLMSEYWRQPELTARFRAADGWARTQDVGYLDADGYLYLLDRLRDLVIVEGSHCYTIAVEDALTSHPAVRRAVAVGLPDPDTGEAVHAAVVLAPGAAAPSEPGPTAPGAGPGPDPAPGAGPGPDPAPGAGPGPGTGAGTELQQELRALVRERVGPLAEPRTVTFVDDIPLTLAGKPDKTAVRAELARRLDDS
jgi:fatty-acyl-CoA synthase